MGDEYELFESPLADFESPLANPDTTHVVGGADPGGEASQTSQHRWSPPSSSVMSSALSGPFARATSSLAAEKDGGAFCFRAPFQEAGLGSDFLKPRSGVLSELPPNDTASSAQHNPPGEHEVPHLDPPPGLPPQPGADEHWTPAGKGSFLGRFIGFSPPPSAPSTNIDTLSERRGINQTDKSVGRRGVTPVTTLMIWVKNNFVGARLRNSGPMVDGPPICGIYCSGFSRDLDDAIRANDAKAVKTALANKADPNQWCGPVGTPGLNLAVSLGHVAVLSALVEAKSDVDGCDGFGAGPLHVAAIHGKPDCIRELAKLGGNPNMQSRTPKLSHLTGVVGTKMWLLEPLHLGCMYEYVPTIVALLNVGADARAKSYDGETPMQCTSNTETGRAISALFAKWVLENPHKVDPAD